LPESTLYLPLFFLTAWLRSNHDLTDHLAYRLSFSKRAKTPAIRRFWLYDLLLSSLALPIAMLVYHSATFGLFWTPEQRASANNLSVLIYPLSFILMGYLWPKMAAVTISFGDSKTTFSIALLRDRLLGGPMLDIINGEIRRWIEEYGDRVAAAIKAKPEAFEVCLRRRFGVTWKHPGHPSEQEIEDVRTRIIEGAGENFDGVFEEVCKIENIPFRGRPKPLMKVEQMTAVEEQLLYDAGYGAVRALYYSRKCPTPRMAEARWRLLRNNAHRLVWGRVRLAGGFAVLLMCATGAGTAFSRLYERSFPVDGASPSPSLDQVDQLKNSGAYK